MDSVINVKVALIGNSGSGKTSIVTRAVYGDFDEIGRATIGAEYFSFNQVINGNSVILRFWDTAGQERFKKTLSMYLNGAHICVIVLDICTKNILDTAKKWYNISKFENRILFVLNKIDLLEDIHQENIKIIEDYSNSLNATLVKTSAKLNNGIEEFLSAIFSIIVKNYPDKNIFQLSKHPARTRKRKCCN